MPQTPPLEVTATWRELWRSGAFAQRRMTWDTEFSREAGDRGLRLGIGKGPLELLDERGALRPIAFGEGGDWSEFVDLSKYEDSMTFREEHPFADWSTYAWDAHGHPHTTALYSPWQTLYLDDVLAGYSAGIDVTVLLDHDRRDAHVESLRPLLEGQLADWQALDLAWSPLLKLLVRLQNRYLPEVTGRTTMIYDTAGGEVQSVIVSDWERERFDAPTAAAQLGIDADQVQDAYWFLLERGLDREPRDEMIMLRRGRPRSSHKQWRGPVRHAQDHFDAAEVLRRFVTDLTGDAPPRRPMWLMDGRQPERGALYDRGPATKVTRRQRQTDLVELDLYPHAIHVVGEGRSEHAMVWRLVAGPLNRAAADEIGFTDLGGSGSASRLPTLVSGLSTYVQRTVVIVDNEGKLAEYATGLVRSGTLSEEDVLRFDGNLEEDNFTAQEMLDVLIEVAAHPEEDGTPVHLTLDLETVLGEHNDRRHGASEPPGLAGTLLGLAEAPEHGGPFRISKPDFAEALAEQMLIEMDKIPSADDAHAELRRRRRLLDFTIDRLYWPLSRARFG